MILAASIETSSEAKAQRVCEGGKHHRASPAADRLAAARVFEEATQSLARLRLVRGASRRTQRRIARAAAVLLAAAGLLSAGQAQAGGAPRFGDPNIAVGLVDMGNSPSFVDIDGDGYLDAFIGNRDGNILFLENATDPPKGVFNPFGLTKVTSYASPAFADLDGDGDLDALVGQLSQPPVTLYFENSGNSASPAFAAPIAQELFSGINGGNPSFADLDADGDLDVFLGANTGETFFFENVGSPTLPGLSPPVARPFGLADVGSASSPAFFDIDCDGDLDAFIGDASGDTFFHENSGDASSPASMPTATSMSSSAAKTALRYSFETPTSKPHPTRERR